MSEPLTEQVDSLRRERDALYLQREIPLLKAEIETLKQSQSMFEGWGDLVDPLEWMRDDQAFGRLGQIVSQISDTADGKNRPTFETEAELAAIQGEAKRICDSDPIAKGAVHNLTSFILGEGMTCKVVKRQGCPDGLQDAVDAVLDEFRLRNKWEVQKEEEAFQRWVIHGEMFPTLYPTPAGQTDLRYTEPRQITEPRAAREIEDWLGSEEPGSWSFGVHTAKDDVEDVYGYYAQWSDDPRDWDYLDADRVIHSKINVWSNVKRGLSDFYGVRELLPHIRKLTRNVAIGSAVLSAIIGIREHAAGTSREQVQGMLARSAFWRQTMSGPNGSQTLNYQRVPPGSWLDTPAGKKYHPSPLANQGVGQSVVTIEQMLLRSAGCNWAMPEYMMSGDASNANYASTLVAESPFIKFCRRRQKTFGAVETEIFWRVLQIACRAGRFSQFGVSTLWELLRYVELQVRGPIVEARDRKAETDRRLSLYGQGGIALETVVTDEGYDFAQEQEKRKSEAKHLKEVPPTGVVLPGQVPGQGQPAGVQPTTQPVNVKQDVQVSPDLMLNGAQVTAATAIVKSVALGEIPRDAGLGQLKVLFNLKDEQALLLMGSAGTSVPTTPNPKPATPAEGGTAESRHRRLEQAAALIWEGYP